MGLQGGLREHMNLNYVPPQTIDEDNKGYECIQFPLILTNYQSEQSFRMKLEASRCWATLISDKKITKKTAMILAYPAIGRVQRRGE